MLIAFNDFNAMVTSILWNLESESRIVILVPHRMNTDAIVLAVAKDAKGEMKITARDEGIKILNNIFIIPASADGSKIRGLRPSSTWIYNKNNIKEEDWATVAFGFAAVSKDPISKVKRSKQGESNDGGSVTGTQSGKKNRRPRGRNKKS